MERKYYCFETMFFELADGLKALCNEMGIKAEVSDGRTWHGDPMIWHFEILANESEVGVIKTWLDARTISERS